MPRKTRTVERKPYTVYSREFKLEALRLANVGNKPKTQVARELGIRVNQLQKWKEQLESELATAAPAKRGRPEDSELELLRKENLRLQEENDILKKAAVGSTGQCGCVYKIDGDSIPEKIK